MNNKRSLYLIPKSLDAKTRIIGLTLDEFIPASLIGIFFVFLGKLILAMLIAAVIVVFIKILKRGQGSAWIINSAYWYLPKCLMGQLLCKTPPSQYREYIA